MTNQDIRETLEKQLQLLSQCSEEYRDDPAALSSLTHAMVELTNLSSPLSLMLQDNGNRITVDPKALAQATCDKGQEAQ